LLLINGGPGDIQFQIPESPCSWVAVLNSADAHVVATPVRDRHVKVAAHGLVLLMGEAQIG
jgi:glycogen operon protein